MQKHIYMWNKIKFKAKLLIDTTSSNKENLNTQVLKTRKI